MNYDIFLSPEGNVYVNELQTVFGSYNPSQMYLNGIPGRFRRRNSTWHFEPGLYNRLGGALLRIQELAHALVGASTGPNKL